MATRLEGYDIDLGGKMVFPTDTPIKN
jgi:hypothetical protein